MASSAPYAIGDKVSYMKRGRFMRNASGKLVLGTNGQPKAQEIESYGLIFLIEETTSNSNKGPAHGILDEDGKSIAMKSASEIRLVARAEATTPAEKARLYNYMQRFNGERDGEHANNDPGPASGGKRSKSRRNRKTKKSRRGSRRH